MKKEKSWLLNVIEFKEDSNQKLTQLRDDDIEKKWSINLIIEETRMLSRNRAF